MSAFWHKVDIAAGLSDVRFGGQSGHSLAALAKVPNPLGAEEEAEQYGKIPHKIGVATSIKITSRPDLGNESHQIGCFTIG